MKTLQNSKKILQQSYTSASDENGFVLVLALLVLLVLVVIGVSSIGTSKIELLLAGNNKFHARTFFEADSGIFITPKVISQTIENDADPVLDNTIFTLLGTDAVTPSVGNRFYKEIMGFVSDAAPEDQDLEIDIGPLIQSKNTEINIINSGSVILAGGGAEFAAGSSGVGAGSTGGTAINYDLTSSNKGANNSITTISARYRKIPGTAGGL